MAEQSLNSCSFSYEDIRNQLVACYNRAGESPRQEDWKPFSKRCELALIWDTLMCRTVERKFFNPIPLNEAHSDQRRYRVFLRDGKIVIRSRNEADERLAAGEWNVEVEYLKQGQHIITRWCRLTIDENFTIDSLRIGQKINKAISRQHGFNKPTITCSNEIADTLDGGPAKCEFEYKSIRDKLTENNGQIFFELALIWDVCMCETKNQKFFNPQKVEAADNSTRKYRLHRIGERLEVESENANIGFNLGTWRVKVEYINDVNGTDTRVCEFQLDGESPITESDRTYTTNGQVITTSFDSTPPFKTAVMTCEKEVLRILDGLQSCEFQYDDIREQIGQCYDLTKGPRRQTKWDWCVKRFVLALIWDTLTSEMQNERKFFEDIVPTKNSVTYCFTVSVKKSSKDRLDISSNRVAEITLQTGDIIVQVNYKSSIDRTTRMRRKLTITSTKLGELLRDSTAGSTERTITVGTNPLRVPEIICSETLKNKLDRMTLEENYCTWQQIKECIDADQTITEDHLLSFLIEIQRVVTENNNADLPDVFETCAKIFSNYDTHGNLREPFLKLACKVYNLLLLRPIVDSQLNHGEEEINPSTTPHEGCHICMNKMSYFEDDREGRTIDCILPQNANEQRFCEIEKAIYLISCTACHVRYVGKTGNRRTESSLNGRYPKHDDVLKERPHFNMPNHEYRFHILQIVEEHTLFDNQGFRDHVGGNVVPLEGVEKLWIDRLIDKSRGDLNVQVNCNYPSTHRSAMAGILRSFAN